MNPVVLLTITLVTVVAANLCESFTYNYYRGDKVLVIAAASDNVFGSPQLVNMTANSTGTTYSVPFSTYKSELTMSNIPSALLDESRVQMCITATSYNCCVSRNFFKPIDNQAIVIMGAAYSVPLLIVPIIGIFATANKARKARNVYMQQNKLELHPSAKKRLFTTGRHFAVDAEVAPKMEFV